MITLNPTTSYDSGYSTQNRDVLKILSPWIQNAPDQTETASRQKAAQLIQAFINNPKQDSLYLCELGLTELPNNFFYMLSQNGDSRLKTLNLAANKLSALPKYAIGYLTALTDLLLFDNQLTYLPEQIG